MIKKLIITFAIISSLSVYTCCSNKNDKTKSDIEKYTKEECLEILVNIYHMNLEDIKRIDVDYLRTDIKHRIDDDKNDVPNGRRNYLINLLYDEFSYRGSYRRRSMLFTTIGLEWSLAYKRRFRNNRMSN